MRRAAATRSRIAHWLADNPVRRVTVLHPQLIAEPAYQDVYRAAVLGSRLDFSLVLEGDRATAFASSTR